MVDVKLNIWNNGPYIVAPSHCPYSYVDDLATKTKIVHPSLCPLCKLCNFTPLEINNELDLKTEEFKKYLTFINTDISTSINNQNYYLQKNNRIPLQILISPEIFDSMLNLVYRDQPEILPKIKAHYINNETPLCYLLGCPVYFSRKLTKSKVMVVGEIAWK